jgi:hypothetical protein
MVCRRTIFPRTKETEISSHSRVPKVPDTVPPHYRRTLGTTIADHEMISRALIFSIINYPHFQIKYLLWYRMRSAIINMFLCLTTFAKGKNVKLFQIGQACALSLGALEDINFSMNANAPTKILMSILQKVLFCNLSKEEKKLTLQKLIP